MNRLIYSIALKFLLGKKSKGVINVISTVSIIGIALGTLALLVVLSVFNGLHDLIGSLYSSFDPDIKIELNEGKSFVIDDAKISELKKIEGVEWVSKAITDNALLKYNKRQVTAVILGVDKYFTKVSNVDSVIVDGKYILKNNYGNQAVVGYMLARNLNIKPVFFTNLSIYAPKRKGKINISNPTGSFNIAAVHPNGIFLVKQMEYDSKFVIVDIDLARKLFGYKYSEVNFLAISVAEGFYSDDVKNEIKAVLGSKYKVMNKQEQHASFYKMMKIEKLMAYLILCFIMLIATFNLIGTMSMLIFDKNMAINTLKSIGANKKTVTKIFIAEGRLISIFGICIGLVLGVTLVLLQQHFGFIQFAGNGAFVVDAYPVKLKFIDVIYSFVTVAVIGFAAVWYPVKVIVKKYF